MPYTDSTLEEHTKELRPDFTQADLILEELQKESHSPTPTHSPADRQEPNPFPVEAFPLGVQQIIRATNQSLRFPVDFTGTAMLCAAATAIGNTHTAYVMQGWQEGAVLYASLVAPPGSNKSHPLTFAFSPLARRDDESYHRYAQERKEYDVLQGLSRKQRDASQSADDVEKPVLRKLLVSDFTQKALTEAHSHNPRGVCVVADELAGFIKNLNRYSSGGDVEFWLSAWSGKTVSVDRLSRISLRIKRPFIPIIGTIQNGVLLQLAKDGKSDNGFIDRFLFALPQNVKKERWSEVSLDESHTYNWEKYLSFLLDLRLDVDEWDTPVPRQMRFTPSAWHRLQEWQGMNTDLCNGAGNEALQGVYTKLESYTVRFSLILQLMAWSCNEAPKEAIELNAVEGAILLAEYFRRTAKVVQRIVHREDPLDRYSQWQRNIYQRLPQHFTTADGLILANSMGVPERTFKSFLRQKDLFIKIGHGQYEKQL